MPFKVGDKVVGSGTSTGTVVEVADDSICVQWESNPNFTWWYEPGYWKPAPPTPEPERPLYVLLNYIADYEDMSVLCNTGRVVRILGSDKRAAIKANHLGGCILDDDTEIYHWK